MHLAGSIAEIRKILQTAADLKADAIHFLAPNVVFILAKNKEDYVYAKTDLLIGQSVLVPRTTYQNMKLYIKGAQEGFKKPTSIFYGEKIQTILFTSGHIYFNESDRLALEVDIITAPLKKDVEFKMIDALQSSVQGQLPILRISRNSLEILKSEMTEYKKHYQTKAQISSDNAIRIEDERLVLYFHHNGQRVRLETEIEDFFANDKSFAYSFSDRALYLFLWIARSTVCDEVVILPRKNYVVLEGQYGDTMIKIRTMLKNDILDKIM